MLGIQRDDGIYCAALISTCEQYRFVLSRTWDRDRQDCLFIALNPSTADHQVDDPTIRRMMGFARAWECGGMVVVNLFALRSPHPRTLRAHKFPVGIGNDGMIVDAAIAARDHDSLVVCCWGNHGSIHGRGADVLQQLRSHNVPLWTFGLTDQGQPRHPLYIPKDSNLVALDAQP